MSSDARKHKISNSSYDVNMRVVQGMLGVELGYSALEKFCMHVNLNITPSKTFHIYKAKLLDGHLSATNKILWDIRKDVKKAHGSSDNDIVGTGVSYNGS